MSTTPEQVQSVEETLEKTDLGHIINENKKPIMVIGGVIVALIIAYSVFNHMQKTKYQQTLNDVFGVESNVFISYLDGKSEADAFKAALGTIDTKFVGHPNLVPAFLNALNKLQEANAVDATVMDHAKKWLDKVDKRSELYLLTGLRMSALYEDQGQADQALSILIDIDGKNYAILEDRIDFELGRLYLAKGDKEKAKTHLQKVIDFKGESELKSMAKIYLSEL